MRDPLADRRPVRELAGSSQVIDIASEIANFPRFEAALAGELAVLDPERRPARWRQRPVTGRLAFAKAAWDAATPTLQLDVATEAAVVCQRCLDAFDLPVAVSLRLQFAGPDAGGDAQDGYELWELDDDTVSPIDVVDEALTMALPLAARHEDDSGCVDVSTSAHEKELTTPFASLKARMESDNKD